SYNQILSIIIFILVISSFFDLWLLKTFRKNIFGMSNFSIFYDNKYKFSTTNSVDDINQLLSESRKKLLSNSHYNNKDYIKKKQIQLKDDSDNDNIDSYYDNINNLDNNIDNIDNNQSILSN